MNHQQDIVGCRHSDANEALLCLRVFFVAVGNERRVVEDCLCFFKTSLMLFEIILGLLCVPFEYKFHSVGLYVRVHRKAKRRRIIARRKEQGRNLSRWESGGKKLV